MKSAIRAGISISDYNEMTPYELSLYVNEVVEIKKEEQEYKLFLTYLGARWQRSKKMPEWEDVIRKQKEKPKEMTDEQMLRTVMALNKAFGGDKQEVKVHGN